MRANLRNQVRQTYLPRWKPLLPLFEAVMNSFQAIQLADRKQQHKISVAIDRDRELVDAGPAAVRSFTIKDSGVGFTDKNLGSFNELFSELKLEEGGKGVGRTMWLKAFDKVEIDSTYAAPEPGKLLRRALEFHEHYEPPDPTPPPAAGTVHGTEIKLIGFREPYREEARWTTEQIVQRLIEHFLLIFLETNCPRVEVVDQGLTTDVNDVFTKEFKSSASDHPFKIRDVDFNLHGFRLYTQRSSKHRLIYAANQRGVVQDNLDDFIPNLSGAKLPGEDGKPFYYLAIVQSPYLTRKVNHARTDFDLAPEDAEAAPSLFTDEVSRAEIRDACVSHVAKDLAGIIQSINEAKAERIRDYVEDAPQYKILMKYLPEFIDEISANPTRNEIETALHRQMHQREVNLRQESRRIIREAEKITDYDEYHQRLSEFMKTFNELGVSQLATYVSHRKIILDFLERAITRSPKDNKYPLERVVHQLVFPRRSTSDDIPYQAHNLWLIDERLTYHSLVTSDKPLSSITEMDTESERRPDLFIFDRRVVFSDDEAPLKNIVLVEFKKPQRNDYTLDDNPVVQCLEMISDIRESKFLMENGRPIRLAGKDIPAFCYIICDITQTLVRVLKTLDAAPMPDGNGYFNFHKDSRAYYEVIDYDKLLSDGRKRNRIFFDKLNIMSQQ
jgi:hypothetical protein